MTDLLNPATMTVVEVAARKGVALDIRLLARPARTVAEAADLLEAGAGQIVKSCVFMAPRPDGRAVPVVCLVAGDKEVDLDLLALVSGEVAIRRPTVYGTRELPDHSALGTSPLQYGRHVPVFMDRDLCNFQWVWAFAGVDVAVFRVSPLTLRTLANATVAPLAAKPSAFTPRSTWRSTFQIRSAA